MAKTGSSTGLRAAILSVGMLADRTAGEYEALTAAAGLLDRSARGKLALSGPDAKSFLHGQVTNDIEGLAPGRGCYAAFLTPKGKMLGDLRVLDAGSELLLDTERSALQDLFDVIRRFSVGHRVQLHKRTLERGLLSLIGPDSLALAAAESLPEDEHSHVQLLCHGVRARAIRTDLGVDLLCAAEDLQELAAALQRAGAVPVGEASAEILRIESGRPRWGVELDQTVIPQEAGLNERAVSFAKGCYVGQETVARLYYKGKPNRLLRGLAADAPLVAGAQLLSDDDRVLGRVGSAALSPRLGPIGLALVRREAPPGTIVRCSPGEVRAKVVELPFK